MRQEILNGYAVRLQIDSAFCPPYSDVVHFDIDVSSSKAARNSDCRKFRTCFITGRKYFELIAVAVATKHEPLPVRFKGLSCENCVFGQQPRKRYAELPPQMNCCDSHSSKAHTVAVAQPCGWCFACLDVERGKPNNVTPARLKIWHRSSLKIQQRSKVISPH
jgi:hypothetical protein